MDDTFFTYLQRLEMMAFFSGYPLIYAIVVSVAGNKQTKTILKNRLTSSLPFGYALVGTLYLGLQLKNFYPDYSIEKIKLTVQQPYLIIWGLLSVLFWIPAIAKKRILSLLHSLVFFFFVARDLLLHSFQPSADKNVVKNDMKIYTDSLLLNMGAFAFILLLSFLFSRYKNRLR
jgi:hypothetical protein